MSKLRKLIVRPRRFLLDSRMYRRLLLAALELGAARVDDLLSWTSAGGIADRAELEAQFRARLTGAVPAADVTDDGRPTIAILREHSHLLSKLICDMARDGARFTLQAYLPGTTTPKPDDLRTLEIESSSDVFSVDDFVRPVPHFMLTLHGAPGVRSNMRVEIWDREGNEYVGPRRNAIAARISSATARERGFFERGSAARVQDLISLPLPTHVGFPVDIVYTWVNHRDPGWRALWRQTVGREPEQERGDSRGLDRYQNRDELKYSLRSVAQYAPWARRIHVVTNCAPPAWLDRSHPKIRWVDHGAILAAEALPVFNSHAIESRLQHVPDLADHFLYFNDDFFLLRPTLASHFFEPSGLSKSFVEPHGSVNGDAHPESPDYLNAARNGRKLIETAFSRSPTALHRHTPYALRREVLLEMEQRFASPIGRTSASRFRSIHDISTVSFLYHHYAYLTGKAIYAVTEAALVKPQTLDYRWLLQQILAGIRTPLTLCLNDGGGSDLFPNWGRDIVAFLEAYFPDKCELER